MTKGVYFYVVAGTHNEFLEYTKNKIDDKFYIYVSGVDKLRGLSEIEGCFYGSYKSRKDIQDIETQIKIIKSKRLFSGSNGTTISTVAVGPAVTVGAVGSSINGSALTTTSIQAIQELKNRIDQLEKQVQDLYSKNNPGPADFSKKKVANIGKDWYNEVDLDRDYFVDMEKKYARTEMVDTTRLGRS